MMMKASFLISALLLVTANAFVSLENPRAATAVNAAGTEPLPVGYGVYAKQKTIATDMRRPVPGLTAKPQYPPMTVAGAKAIEPLPIGYGAYAKLETEATKMRTSAEFTTKSAPPPPGVSPDDRAEWYFNAPKPGGPNTSSTEPMAIGYGALQR